MVADSQLAETERRSFIQPRIKLWDDFNYVCFYAREKGQNLRQLHVRRSSANPWPTYVIDTRGQIASVRYMIA
jgi:hypothetical protein